MKRIIVADDDPGIQDVVRMILTRSGYDVTTYANGNNLLSGNFIEPDLFIIDKQLHNVDGLDVCRFLKNRNLTSAPVILFSASGRMSARAYDAGADAFLEKPFKMKLLLELVEKLIGGNN